MKVSATQGLRVDAQTLAFHQGTLIFDSLSLNYVLDEAYTDRVLAGGVNATIVTFAAEDAWGTSPLWDATQRLVETGLEKIERSEAMILAICADDIVAAQAKGKLAVIMGFQSASMIGRDFWRLRLLHRLGLRCLQLNFNAANLYGDGWGERRNGGLTFLGRELIEAANELKMMLDLSHCGQRTTLEAIDIARAPVCTHANAYSVNPNDRCKKDEVIRALVAKGGMVGVQFAPSQVKLQDPRNATLDDAVKHVDYYKTLVGDQHVGIGTGFTEGFQEHNIVLPESARWRRLRPEMLGPVEEFVTLSYPKGIESIQLLPNFTQALFDRGYSKGVVTAVLGGNWLRTFRAFVG